MNYSFLGGNTLSQLIIPESQIAHNEAAPNITNTTLKTGVPELDHILSNVKPSCGNGVYEIYGPPGIGKTTISYNILQNSPLSNYLWIDTLKSTPFPMENKIRLTSLTQLQMFFQKKIHTHKYDIIVVDGFSKLLVQYLNNQIFKYNISSSTNASETHQLKVNALQTLFIHFSKYAEQNNCKIILVNDCMNTSYKYNPDMNNSSSASSNNNNNQYQFVDESNPFLVVKRQQDSCMLLKSELEACIGVGSLDSKWLRFVKLRLGLYYTFDNAGSSSKDKYCINCIVSQNKQNRNSEFQTTVVSFQLPQDYHYYSTLVRETTPANKEVSITANDTNTNEPSSDSISVLAASSQFQIENENMVIFESQI